MIIVKDSRNCLFNAAGPVTDTAWLKLHEKDSSQCRHAPRLAHALPVSPSLSLQFFPREAHIDSDVTAAHKTEANGRGLADKRRGGDKEREGTAREIWLLICKKTNIRGGDFPAHCCDGHKKEKKKGSDKRREGAIWLSDSSEL